MTHIYTIFCGVFLFRSGSADDLGAVVSEVSIGYVDPDSNIVPSDDKATNNVINLLESIREIMPVGKNVYLPPTDPYVSDGLPNAVFNNPQSKLQGEVRLENLIALGGSQFVINHLEIRINPSTVNFDISVPSVIADINYKATDFLYGADKLDISGSMRITLDNLRVTGTLCLEQEYTDSDKTHLVVIGLEVKNSIGNIKVDKDTSGISQSVIQEIIDIIAACMAEAAMWELNEIFYYFNIEEVLDFLAA